MLDPGQREFVVSGLQPADTAGALTARHSVAALAAHFQPVGEQLEQPGEAARARASADEEAMKRVLARDEDVQLLGGARRLAAGPASAPNGAPKPLSPAKKGASATAPGSHASTGAAAARKPVSPSNALSPASSTVRAAGYLALQPTSDALQPSINRPSINSADGSAQPMSTAARKLSLQLEATGMLSAVRAQLHAAVFGALASGGGSAAGALTGYGSGLPDAHVARLPADSAAELAAAGLVLDFLEHFQLGNTLAVARSEAAWPTGCAEAAAAAASGPDLSSSLKNGAERPLLVRMLEARAPEWDWRLDPAYTQQQQQPRCSVAGMGREGGSIGEASSTLAGLPLDVHSSSLVDRNLNPGPAPASFQSAALFQSATEAVRQRAGLPSLQPIVFSRTHAGGSGRDLKKLNQDAHFVLKRQCRDDDEDIGPFAGGARARAIVAVGVFDGHGTAHGHVASSAAREAVELAIERSGFVAALETDAAGTMHALFLEANEAAVEAMNLQPGVLRQGTGRRSLLLQRVDDEEGEEGSYLDVVDGGTTASLVILLDGRWLYTAAVGDSSGLLISNSGTSAGWVGGADSASSRNGTGGATHTGTHGRAGAAGTPVTNSSNGRAAAITNSGVFKSGGADFKRLSGGVKGGAEGCAVATPLWRDHTPLDEGEFLRMHGQGARFVYDVPSLFDGDDQQRPVWALDRPTNRARVSVRAESRARQQGVACKSVRGELSTLVLSPPSERFSQIGLTVTRSLGDVYMHSFGVSAIPEVHVFDLLEDASDRSADEVSIVVATDGMWDLWTHEHVADSMWACDARAFERFCEDTRAEGERKFGNASDNFSVVLLRVPLLP
mmetsp:Transcript_48598/g.113778  ORF Transcript_48598/g.113778 Transcript_48598/m.113778 type:complete len:843 (+) Transcript_48598:105-2633(+)